MRLLLLLCQCLLSLESISAWLIVPQEQLLRPHHRRRQRQQQRYSGHTRQTIIIQLVAETKTATEGNNNQLQEEGSKLIRQAAIDAGCTSDRIVIEWKPGRVVVTISGSTYVHDDQAEDDNIVDDEFQGDVDDDDSNSNSNVMPVQQDRPQDWVNLVEVSRAIHDALDMNKEDSVGYRIGLNYEIEVTTPGAPDELSGIMFQSYRGFDVLVDFTDPKTKKRKTIEGRLVERNDEFTVINIKGRMKRIQNDMVESVKLPKAKKEKNIR